MADINKAHLANLQVQLAQKVQIPDERTSYKPEHKDVLFSLDVHYEKNNAYVGVDVQQWRDDRIATFVGHTKVSLPYLATFFCFREGPVLFKLISAIKERFGLEPDLFLVDRHGIAHPRRCGLACWIGINTDAPTIGCAKKTLLRYHNQFDLSRGNILFIKDSNEDVGAAVVTKDNVKPVFVSVGHKIYLQIALNVVLELAYRYRIPEPLRRADHDAKAYAAGILSKNKKHVYILNSL